MVWLSTFQLATCNIRHALPIVKFRDDVRAVLSHKPDVAGFQECSGADRRKALPGLAAEAGMSLVNLDPYQTPIAFNSTRFRLVSRGTWHLTDRTKVGPAGAGPVFMSRKEAVYVVLADRATGELVAYVNAHLVPSIYLPIRARLHRKQLVRLAALVGQLRIDYPGVMTFVGGDFNCDAGKLVPLRAAGLDQGGSTLGTHGKRAIDHIVSDVPMVKHVVLPRLHTDHSAVLADFATKETPPVVDPTELPRDPYTRVTFRGRLVDAQTMGALLVAEKRLGYELTITQGSYNAGGVSASAGTHDGGGVVDLAPYDYKRKVRVLRDLGWAAWYRPAIPGLWSAHIHAILIGNSRMSSGAAAQVVDYKNGLDGLAGKRPDPNPYRPDPPVVFDYAAARRDDKLRERIKGLAARIKALRDRISYKGGKSK